ncbi:hypothetical protein RF11_14164 [Thelohanellus kitauei]|uniref:Reverse transcriptase RNase H-like domain-containing protein n=1 Tax=Thelohanellus kitauei TaxID=669202 RepID=A0A0C2I9E2_THEKT|nr:hypothetical protein RF11_14164 [Thelohanellus kitauei]
MCEMKRKLCDNGWKPSICSTCSQVDTVTRLFTFAILSVRYFVVSPNFHTLTMVLNRLRGFVLVQAITLNNQYHLGNYSITDREILSIVYATKRLRHYLLGQILRFIRTTIQIHIMKTKDSHGGKTRWLAHLSQFEFDIMYIKGNENNEADSLSRITLLLTTTDSKKLIMVQQQDHDIQIIKKMPLGERCEILKENAAKQCRN